MGDCFCCFMTITGPQSSFGKSEIQLSPCSRARKRKKTPRCQAIVPSPHLPGHSHCTLILLSRLVQTSDSRLIMGVSHTSKAGSDSPGRQQAAWQRAQDLSVELYLPSPQQQGMKASHIWRKDTLSDNAISHAPRGANTTFPLRGGI